MSPAQSPVSFRRAIQLTICLLLGFAIHWASQSPLLVTRLNQSPIAAEQRIQQWNWQPTAEETFCRSPLPPLRTTDSIPNTVHFILLAPEGDLVELNYARFLAIKAAIIHMYADQIKLHTTGLNESNPLWKTLSPHITLVPIDRAAIHTPNNISLSSLALAHQADLLRISIILREGGIYLDTDVYTLKPFTDLLINPRDTLMGHEGGNRYGLCNAVIVSRANSDFMVQWHEAYTTFDARAWNVHSVLIPKRLQIQAPNLLCPLSPTVFFWPTWAAQHVRYMHEPIGPQEVMALQRNLSAFGGAMFPDQLAFHAVAATDYLPNITFEEILQRDTRFNILVRGIAAAPFPDHQGRELRG